MTKNPDKTLFELYPELEEQIDRHIALMRKHGYPGRLKSSPDR
jgi:hypothetical protein